MNRSQAKKKNNKSKTSVHYQPFVVTRNSVDGLALEGMPSLRAIPAQPLYKYDLLVEQWKRYSMSVGVSPISDYISFSLSQIPGIQNFLNIYDFYRIKKVVCLFKVLGTQVYMGNSSGDVPRLSVAIDYNDGTSTGAPAQSYQNCITTVMTGNFVRSFSPRTAIQLFNGSLSTAYIEGKPNQWIDTNYPAVPHYGLVINIGATSIDNQFVVGLDVLFCLEFKDPRFYASSASVGPLEERRPNHLIGRISLPPRGDAPGPPVNHQTNRPPKDRDERSPSRTPIDVPRGGVVELHFDEDRHSQRNTDRPG